MHDLLDTWWIIHRTYAMLLKHITCVLYTLLEGPIRPYIAPHRVMWHDFSHHDCMVAGITNDLSSPHRPVRLLARSQSMQYFSNLVDTRLSIWFSVVLSSFSLVYPPSTLSSVCVRHHRYSLLITCPYQFNLLSVVFLETCATHNVLLLMSYIHQRL